MQGSFFKCSQEPKLGPIGISGDFFLILKKNLNLQKNNFFEDWDFNSVNTHTHTQATW